MNLLRSFVYPTISLIAALVYFPQSAVAEVASVKAMGMGYTGVAYPQDALAGAYNPAGMAWVGDRFDIGVTGKRYDGSVIISGNQITDPLGPDNGTFNAFRRKNFISGDVGFNQTFTSWWNETFSVGLVGYERNFFHPTYSSNFFLLGSSKLEFEYENYVIAPVIAFQFGDHSIGASADFHYCHLKIRGLETFAGEMLSLHPNHFTNQGGDNSWGVGATVGWQWHVFDCFTVGATFQPQTSIKNFTRYRGFLAERGKLDSPQIFSIGFAVKPICELTFTFDYEHINWNKVRSISNNGEPSLIDAIILDTDQDFGQPDGPGFGWRNQTSLKFGIDWRVCKYLILRGGYRFRNTPVRSSQTFLNMLTMETVSHTATAGISFEFFDFHELSFYYAHGFKGDVNGNNQSIPPFFGAGKVSLSSHLNVVGLSYGWNW